jgi:peptidoglycan/LPS O-acetylase OafA/YrhL
MNEMNYAFLDGLRGFGALTVYLQHFAYELYPYFLYGRPEPGTKAAEEFHEPPKWLMIT